MTNSVASTPLISVVLTTYNRQNLLPRAVDSVLKGTYQNFELLIIDDASTDDTLEVVGSFKDSRIKYHRMESNRGVLRARNRGFDLATGDYITILDDDDELLFKALETVQIEFSKSLTESVDVLWFDCIDAETGKISGSMPRSDCVIRFEDYVCGKIEGDFWLIFSRKALKNNRFCEELKAHEHLLWLKIHKDFTGRHVPIVLCKKYRLHGEQRLCHLNSKVMQLRETTLALRQHVSDFGDVMLRECPERYASKLAYLGLHEMMTGEFTSGRRSVLRSLKYRFSVKYLALVILSWFVGSRQLIALYRCIESSKGKDPECM